MQFNALIEEWPGESMAYFRELPGCYCSATTYEALFKNIPASIADYLKWARANDITVLDEFDGQVEVVIKEHLVAEQGEIGPLFEADLPPPDDIEIDKALNVAAAARAALLELYEQVSPAQQMHRLSPASWSLTEHMQHLLESETWYVSRLSEQPVEPAGDSAPADLAMQFFDNAMDYELALRALTPEQRQRIYTHDGEQWTAAKVLRRMTGHLREHYPWMEEIVKTITHS
jgi:predicted RNase H-like HicB family nuclease